MPGYASVAPWALLGVDFETMGAMQLYRASDALMKHPRPSNRTCSARRWDFSAYVVRTSTRVRRPISKRRPLVRRRWLRSFSRVFAGNVKEDRTLAGMLSALEAPPGARVHCHRAPVRENGYTSWSAASADAGSSDHRTRGGPRCTQGRRPRRRGSAALLFEERAKKERGISASPRASRRTCSRGAVAAAHAKETRPGLAASGA